MIRLESVELRELHMPLVRYFETSFGRTDTRRIILLTALSSDGCPGYGECTAAEDPFYNHETTETAWHILADFAVPLLLGRCLESAADAAALLRPIRGNGMARAAIEVALWELESRFLGRSLSRHIGGTRERIECGVSIGIQASIDELLARVRAELSEGYRRIKIKIKPGWDLEPVRAIRAEFPAVPLMVDANSAFRLEDLPLFRRLDEFGLMMIEQPLDHDDIIDHAALQREIRTPVCLDEAILSMDDARKAIDLGSCRIINVKLGRVGGFAEVRRLHEYCLRAGVSVWCGGMLESGVGRAHNIALSSLPGFTLPGDVSASKRYYEEDTIRPPVTVTEDGTIPVPTGVGLGFEIDFDRVERATVRKITLRR